MRLTDPKCKYIFAFILLLGVFLCGYNSKQWYATNHRIKKNISLIYSCSKDKIGHGRFEELVKQEFKAQGIEPVFDEFYLDCDRFDQKVEMEHIGNYLEILKTKPIDLILAVGDQAAFSLLLTRHRLLYSIPVEPATCISLMKIL